MCGEKEGGDGVVVGTDKIVTVLREDSDWGVARLQRGLCQ